MKKALELKKKYLNEREKLFDALIKSNDGVNFNKNHTQLVDRIVKALVKEILNHFPVSNFSLIAVGGYGRQDLSPKSDVDLLFLYKILLISLFGFLYNTSRGIHLCLSSKFVYKHAQI